MQTIQPGAALSERVEKSGFYEVTSASEGLVYQFAVNVDGNETNLSPMNAEALTKIVPQETVVGLDALKLWLAQARGHGVHVIDNLSTGAIDNLGHLKSRAGFGYTIDSVLNEPVLAELVDRADVVFHLAAAVGVRLIVESPVNTIETNVQDRKSTRLNSSHRT